jgi:riboflavin kinase/FMN adenylyltransferase
LKTLRNIAELQQVTRPVSLAIGFFDGVHLGHGSVIQQARTSAASHGGESWILTFDPHPRNVLQPETAPPLLSPTRRKLQLFEEQGVDGCLLMTFDHGLASQTPAEFLGLLRRSIPTLTHVAVGQNFHFGHNRAGNPGVLAEHLEAHGIEVHVAEPMAWEGDPISSTRVRNAISEGRLGDAAAMLGRNYTVAGVVESERQVGRQLGFPTANISHEQQVLPPNGVYAAQVSTADDTHAAVLNLGCRPTMADSEETRLEVHILDFEGNLYGSELRVSFIENLRGEREFPSVEELSAQISRDVDQARMILLAKGSNSL